MTGTGMARSGTRLTPAVAVGTNLRPTADNSPKAATVTGTGMAKSGTRAIRVEEAAVTTAAHEEGYGYGDFDPMFPSTDGGYSGGSSSEAEGGGYEEGYGYEFGGSRAPGDWPPSEMF